MFSHCLNVFSWCHVLIRNILQLDAANSNLVILNSLLKTIFSWNCSSVIWYRLFWTPTIISNYFFSQRVWYSVVELLYVNYSRHTFNYSYSAALSTQAPGWLKGGWCYPPDNMFVLLTLIHWIVIYLVDSIIQPSSNWGQVYKYVLAIDFLYDHIGLEPACDWGRRSLFKCKWHTF